MLVRLFDEKDCEAYNDFLRNYENSLLYHSLKYKNFLTALLGCTDEYVLAMDGGKICGVMPLMYIEQEGRRVYNSLPYYGSHGSILDNASKARALLTNTYNDIAVGLNTISSTVVTNVFEIKNHSFVHNYQDFRIGQVTYLSNSDSDRAQFMKRVDSSARRNVKKAKSNGIRITIENDQFEALKTIHTDAIMKIGGIPKSNRFFELFPSFFKPDSDYNIFTARLDGEIIAALLLLFFNRTVEYFIPATNSDFLSLQPLSLILLEAITYAAHRGFLRWNWGGTWDSQLGVYRFKRKWAATDLKYNYLVQLNDLSLLNWTKTKLLKTFPNFFVVPFSCLIEESK